MVLIEGQERLILERSLIEPSRFDDCAAGRTGEAACSSASATPSGVRRVVGRHLRLIVVLIVIIIVVVTEVRVVGCSGRGGGCRRSGSGGRGRARARSRSSVVRG